MSNIQVIHISTGHDGGAGNAARRLSAALNEFGIKSIFVSLKNHSYHPSKNEIEIKRNLPLKIVSAVNARLQFRLSKKFFFSLYSLDLLSVRKIKKIAGQKTTILHIHNWFNLLNQKKINKLLNIGYPVVITLHDERFYTGGCHHAFECKGFVNECSNCPQISTLFKHLPVRNVRKSSIYFEHHIGALQVIAPSMWIFNRAKNSQLFKSHEIHFIPNTLGKFGYSNEILRTPDLINPKIIGIANVDLNSYLKGADIIQSLQELIHSSSLNYKLVFLNSDVFKGKSKSSFWGMIDVLLVPSRADNSPNIIHEAKRMGIPVIATLVGGITELLDPNFDEPIPIQNLNADYIIGVLENWRVKNRVLHLQEMQHKFDAYTNCSVKNHVSLYNKLNSSKNL